MHPLYTKNEYSVFPWNIAQFLPNCTASYLTRRQSLLRKSQTLLSCRLTVWLSARSFHPLTTYESQTVLLTFDIRPVTRQGTDCVVCVLPHLQYKYMGCKKFWWSGQLSPNTAFCGSEYITEKCEWWRKANITTDCGDTVTVLQHVVTQWQCYSLWWHRDSITACGDTVSVTSRNVFCRWWLGR
jgi:hypothetical protein